MTSSDYGNPTIKSMTRFDGNGASFASRSHGTQASATAKRPFKLRSTGLINEQWLRCRHCIVAANFAAEPNRTALIEASQEQWTPTQFADVIATRKKHIVVGDAVGAAMDDAATAELRVCERTAAGMWREVPDRPKPPKGPRWARWFKEDRITFTRRGQYEVYSHLLKAVVPPGRAAEKPTIIIAALPTTLEANSMRPLDSTTSQRPTRTRRRPTVDEEPWPRR
jgi:hypothetical protein